MRRHGPRLLASVTFAALIAVLFPGMPGLDASNPRGAYYSADTDKVFWFVQTSDLHIGARGSADTDRLRWLVTTGRSVINPSFTVVTGDLTDSTNGNWLGIPNGPYQAEWDTYKNLLAAAGITAANYYDLPGNHDAYNDATFTYYLANSIQGKATGRTQHSWTRTFSFGKYHFLGINSAGNTGASFSLSFPFGDPAGLDPGELSFIDQELFNHADARLTMVFGHHPVTDTGASDDTWLFYGERDFIAALDGYHASAYDYGHTHDFSDVQFTGNGYTGLMANGGIRYTSIASLGKSSSLHYSVTAIDCNGVSTTPQTVGTWPAVMVTAPLSKYVGSALNPYNYPDPLPKAPNNPIRALVFDANTVTSVTYRVNGATAVSMAAVAGSPALWSGAWDASTLSPGEHVIRVTATSASGTRFHEIRVEVAAATNRAPVAEDDSYTTAQEVPLSVSASGVLANDMDPDGDSLTAAKSSDPSHGTVTLNADGSFTYTPAAGYAGADSFTYTASDGKGGSSSAMVSLTVTATANVAPVARPDAYTATSGVALKVDARGVLSNDSDADGNPITAAVDSGPVHGSLTLNNDGGFTYTSSNGYIGTDTFTYTASDGNLTSNTATVTITVNAAPVAEVVTVVNATWSLKTKKLSITATSSAQPGVTLTVVGFSTMTWNKRSGSYTFSATVATMPGSVAVTSSGGGSATETVTPVK